MKYQIIQDDISFERAIAEDSVQTLIYNAETQNQNRQYLFERLSTDSVLRFSDTLFTSFYNEYENASIGALHDVKEELVRTRYYPTSSIALLQLTDSLIELTNDSLTRIDEICANNKWINHDSILSVILHRDSLLIQTRQYMILLQRVDGEGALALADIINSNIVPTELPEQNIQFMNDIYISYRQNGLSGISEKYTQISEVAHQCPYSGGEAVYQARSFVELFYDTVEYDDDAVCLQNGIFRQGNSVKKELTQTISIKPNPANDKVEISLMKDEEGICNIRISDLL